MRRVQKVSLFELKNLAKDVAKKLRGGEVLALIGNLGSGKTTFTKYLATFLKVKRRITSPTFTLMQEAPGRLKSGKRIVLYHLDLYRIRGYKEVEALGLKQIWQKPEHIVVIEWANKIKKYLPKNTYYIYFKF